jgi:hypothetical protein
MDLASLASGFNATPLWVVALLLFGTMSTAAYLGTLARNRWDERRATSSGDDGESETHEGYIVSAVLGLLALLLGFTFSLAVDRFDARRELVRDEANAINVAYMRAQLLDQPYRDRTSRILTLYLENRIALAKARPPKTMPLLARNDALIAALWATTIEAFPSIRGYDWSSAYLDTINRLTELDTSRKVARLARVPSVVFGVLIIYMVTSAFVLGYVLRGRLGRMAAGALLALFTVALVLILDIDRPIGGGIDESQAPMEMIRHQWASPTPAA